MTRPGREAECAYLVPSRTLSGTPEEVLGQIDEAVQGLLALRHLIAVQRARQVAAGAAAVHTGPRLVPVDLQSASANR